MPKTKPTDNKPQIEHLSVEALIPYASNSRTHSEEQVAQIAASIREFGFTNPVLVDNDNGIIAGHGRVMAARKLGLAEVPCIRLSYLTETQRKAYVIADNKIALNAGWDLDLLKIELAGLREEDGFDLSLTGFNDIELNSLLAGVDVEGIDTDEGESTSGGDVAYLVIGKFRIPLEVDEENALTEVVESYAAERGTTLGFGAYLLRKIEQ
jgi:ParB-like chromosome segregation protein Spo0J